MLRYPTEVTVALWCLTSLSSFPFDYDSPQYKEFKREGPDGRMLYVSLNELLSFLAALEKKYDLNPDVGPYSDFVGDAVLLFEDRLFKIRTDHTQLIFSL